MLWYGGSGGAELHTARLAAALRSRGHWIGVLILSNPRETSLALHDLGVPFCEFDLRRGRQVSWVVSAVRRALDEVDPDIVILPHNDFLVALLRAAGCRRLLVAMEHGAALMWHRLPTMRKLAYLVFRCLGSRILVGEIAVSSFASANLQTLPHAPVAVASNGVDTRLFEPTYRSTGCRHSLASDGASPLVFAVGSRLVDGKGVDIALEAIARLNRSAPGARAVLRIAGDGPDRQRLQRLVSDLGIGGRVEFYGVVHDMPAFWAAADVAIHVPDRFVESFGLSPAEAVACGCRAIVADAPAAREVLADCPAVSFVPLGDVLATREQLAREVVRGPVSDEERRAYHDWIDGRLSMERAADRYEAILSEWIGKGPRHGRNSPSHASNYAQIPVGRDDH